MTEILPTPLAAWRDAGRMHRLAGLDIYCHEAGPADAPALFILHGFPSDSHDWRRILPLLAVKRRVILFDFPGYGLSSKPDDYSYSLFEQADIAEMVAREHGLVSVDLLAHDMGTSVACELMARRERGLLSFETRSLTLMNGSVHIELAQLTPSQKLLRTRLGPLFARLSSRHVFMLQLRRILGKPVPEAELEAMWLLLKHRNGRLRLPETIRYIDERYRFHKRWIGALTRLDIPTKILWGRLDPVAVPAIAEALAAEIPGASLQWMEDLGHYPQMEDPAQVAAALLGFLQTVSPQQG